MLLLAQDEAYLKVGLPGRQPGRIGMRASFWLDLYRRISLKTKLMFIAIIFIIYPIIIIGYFGYRNYADNMKEKAVRDMQSSAQELTGLLSDRMAKLNLFAVQILYDNTIYNANRMLINGTMDYIAENDFNSYLQSNLFLKSELNEILVRFTVRNRIFQVNRTMGSTTDSIKLVDVLHSQALKGKGKPVWYVSYKDGKENGIYITKIIYDINDIKKETGLLIFKVNEQYLSEVLNNFMTNTSQNVTIYGSDKQAVFSYEPFDMKNPTMDSVFMANGSSAPDGLVSPVSDSGLKEVRSGNDTIYLLYDTVRPEGWKLVMGVSSNILLKDVRNIAKFILVLCAATLPICLLLVNFLYSDIIKPMNLLIRRMRQVERGEIGITIENKRSDEFGFVNSTFNRMSLEIKNLIDTVYKKQIITKDAELKALQAQINPHFLYNTLDSINWKAKINGINEISEMVSALSSIIEANLNRKNEKSITLGKEIEYINNYYFLLQKRFGKKINLETDIQEDILDCTIPKLIIQPIIENAVHHGLEMKVGSGLIRLNARKDQGRLIIIVSDDGTGIDEKTLERLNRSLAAGPSGEEDSTAEINSSIGIINVQRRVKLLYGDEFGLQISSMPGRGTTVTITLPVVGGGKASTHDTSTAGEGADIPG